MVVGTFAVRRYPAFWAALVGGYTFLRWPLNLLFDRASGSSKVSSKYNAASRFVAAVISAWFSFDILNYEPMSKVDRKNLQQATQNEHDDGDTNCSGLKLQYVAEYGQTFPPSSAGKTMDLTLLAVTRALDTLIVNNYHWYYPLCPDTAFNSSTLTVLSRYADTFVFALSSSAVVCLQFRGDSFRSFTRLDLHELSRVSQMLTSRV